ncbi:septum-promoting GTP-binding protein 1-like [Cynara cardunculus var. scolymus]|uniref:Mitochondrial Rho-like protein n=1 Tax=Cynara cardunculus var. scolymus TaxID=59895 RepID=A0A103Y3Y1_CYNCS|nr:septum-promoting GTP-binding protein 1-like [Cynara cardunculus var. scolymus]KVI02019.1 Mitochondrial Rho-like protein [Cynara cardunculus var. scolymus]
MAHLCRKLLRLKLKRTIIWRVAVLRRCAGSLWDQVLACWIGKPIQYRQILESGPTATVCHHFPSGEMGSSCGDGIVSGEMRTVSAVGDRNKDASDLVALKITLLGDNLIGKTSFLAKYIGKEKKHDDFPATEVKQMDKTLSVRGARISYSIWEVGGDAFSADDCGSTAAIRVACKDSVAILFMFDLTSRCTLNSVIGWYQQARKYNQTAIPVMVGSKFDDFIELPIDLQWTISSEARAYAKAINATLFFSSASYNINVNKIFKFVTAKLFNLPWNLERNLKVGEPIIDF